MVGDEIKPFVFAFDTLDSTPLRFFVGDDGIDGRALNVVVTHHRGQVEFVPLRIGQNPGPSQVADVADGVVAFLLQFGTPSF